NIQLHWSHSTASMVQCPTDMPRQIRCVVRCREVVAPSASIPSRWRPTRRRELMDTGLFAVIPTLVILGPVALVTLLLSAIFGRIHSGLRQWSVLFAVAACDAILYIVHFAFREQWRDSWLGSQFTLWMMLTSTTLAGVLWAWRNRRQAGLSDGPA